MLAISGGDFHIWSMSFILFCIFMWNKLILWRKFLLFFEVEYFVILLLKMFRFFKRKAWCLSVIWEKKMHMKNQQQSWLVICDWNITMNGQYKNNYGRMEQMWGWCGKTQSRHKSMKLFSHYTVCVFNRDIFPSMHLTSEQSGVDLIVMAFQTPSKHNTSLD